MTSSGTVQNLVSTLSYRSSLGIADDKFRQPFDVAVGPSGNIYVADTGWNRIHVFDSTGAHQLSFGSHGTDNGQFRQPYGVAVSPSGSIYVADTRNNRIQVFDTAYAFKVTGLQDQTTLSVKIGAGRIQDMAGNANEASNVISVDIDRTAS